MVSVGIESHHTDSIQRFQYPLVLLTLPPPCESFIFFNATIDCGDKRWKFNPKNGQSYRIVTKSANHASAERECKRLGGRLASFHSKDEFKFLVQLRRKA